MTLRTLIEQKDYDYISIRLTLPESPGGSVFAGFGYSENGKFIPGDQDEWDIDKPILEYEEWSSRDAQNGLTILFEEKQLQANGVPKTQKE